MGVQREGTLKSLQQASGARRTQSLRGTALSGTAWRGGFWPEGHGLPIQFSPPKEKTSGYDPPPVPINKRLMNTSGLGAGEGRSSTPDPPVTWIPTGQGPTFHYSLISPVPHLPALLRMEGFLGSGGAALGRRGNPRQGQTGKVQAAKAQQSSRTDTSHSTQCAGLAWWGGGEELTQREGKGGGGSEGQCGRSTEWGARV